MIITIDTEQIRAKLLAERSVLTAPDRRKITPFLDKKRVEMIDAQLVLLAMIEQGTAYDNKT